MRLESAELNSAVPTEYRADLVVLLVEGKPVLGIIVEVQLSSDDDKRFAWPVYVSTLRSRVRCDCVLLVVTPDAAVARWAARPIALGPGSQLLPLVLGPAGVPVVNDPEKANQNPELSILSAIAHGKGDVDTAVSIALSAFSASQALDEDTRALYFDLIDAALSDAARKAFAMLPQDYQFQGPSFLKGKLEGKLEGELKGKLEGQALGEASAVITFLETRGIAVSDTQRQQILGCTDLDTLKRWVRRAVTTRSVEELFDL